MTADIGAALVRALGDVAAPALAVSDPQGLRRLLHAAGWEAFGGLDLAATATALAEASQSIQAAIDEPPTELLDLALVLARLARPLATVADAVQAEPDAPADLATDLAEVLLEATLARLGPVLPVLELLGVAEQVELPAIDSNGWRRRPTVRRRVHLDRLADLCADPLSRLRPLMADPHQLAAFAWPLVVELVNTLGWGATTADTDPAAPDAADLRRILVVDILTSRTPPTFTRIAAGVENEPADGLVATVVVAPELEWSTTRGGWTASVAVPGPRVLRISKQGITDGGAPAEVTVAAEYTSTTTPALRLGHVDGMHFDVQTVHIGAMLTAGEGGPDLVADIALTGLRLAIQATDGFLGALLGPKPADVDGDLVVRLSIRDGVSFAGSRAPRLQLSGKRSIGPIDLVDVAVEMLLDRDVGLELTAGIVARLGPVTVRVDRIGVRAGLTTGDSTSPLPITAGFRPPAGMGALIAAGPVTGGGYLYCDYDKGEYAGVVQLQFKAIAVTAIGLVNTKLPGGRPGWSFLVLLAVEFPGLPLGFGISLYGVGGLVGINRSVSTGTVRDLVRAGRLESLLFPRDPVANAAQVLADLAQAFPVEEGRFTIGLMVRLGWGPGPLITVEAGVVLEVPSPVRLVVLAKLRAVLPTAEAALVDLRLDVAGIVDFGRGEASIDGALVGSRIGPFAISGEMALRASWGASKHFALAAGGFHPRFPVPDGFPALRRISVSLAESQNPRLRLDAYLAVTAATVQLGAKLEVYAATEVLGYIVSGSATLGFDALVRFQPRFSFEADIYGSITVCVNGDPELTASVALRLTGPAPWHAVGVARVSIAFLPEVTLPVEASVGEPDTSSPPAVSVAARMLDDLSRPAAIEALPVSGGTGTVVFRQPAEAERAAHPGAAVAVRQRTAPLGTLISRLGPAIPTDPGTYSIVASMNGVALAAEPISDLFSPGQYRPEDPQTQLGRPEFEQLPAGVVITGVAPAIAADAIAMAPRSDDRIIGPVVSQAPPAHEIGTGLASSVIHGWAAARADAAAAALAASERFSPRVRPARLVVRPDRWVVVDPDTLTPITGSTAGPAMVADEVAGDRRAAGLPALVMPLAEAAGGMA